MRCRSRIAAASGLILIVLSGCSSPLGPRYEYEEQLDLGVDGSATVTVDASIPALVALRGLPLDPSLESAVDRDAIQRLFAGPGCRDVRVSQPWVRQSRHFVQVQFSAPDVRQISTCGPMAWSRYVFERDANGIHFDQQVGSSAGGDPGPVHWDGTERVAFRLHLPSRILYHNVKRLEDGQNGEKERGNILTWEQYLADRRAGAPLHLEVRMGAESILIRTLSLFAGAFVAAVIVLATLIWLTARRGRKGHA